MRFPELKEKTRLKNLENPSGKIKIVIDTDTYNEVDDQFAVIYALKSSKKLNVEAIYAAPFDNDRSENPHDGMKKSYQEILRVLDKANLSNNEMVFKGSNAFLQNYNAPLESPVAQDLVERALKAEKKLYVVALGAITNISSAILMEPDIIKKIIVVWLGGHSYHWPHTKEFNLKQDILSSRLIFDCGVPLVQIPCMGVASHLHTSIPELETYLSDSEIGNYLVNIVKIILLIILHGPR